MLKAESIKDISAHLKELIRKQNIAQSELDEIQEKISVFRKLLSCISQETSEAPTDMYEESLFLGATPKFELMNTHPIRLSGRRATMQEAIAQIFSEKRKPLPLRRIQKKLEHKGFKLADNSAWMALHRMKKKGLISKVGHGLYEYTGNYGNKIELQIRNT